MSSINISIVNISDNIITIMEYINHINFFICKIILFSIITK